jgi:phosphoribosylanthranilate isomerase
MAVRYGASALGLVARMPSGPGVISDERIATIARRVPPAVDTFLLTAETEAAAVVAHHGKVRTGTVQLVDALQKEDYGFLREKLPGVRVVQVIHVRDEHSIREALRIAPQVDALLLDSGRPDLPVKELGGTGKVHDWRLSRRIVQETPVPVFLAGGLRSDNVQAALDAVRPFGLDLCSGVRTDGRLDERKLAAFFRAVEGY